MAQQSSGNGAKNQDRFSYKILKHYGVISSSIRGWTREFNLVQWNDREPKYDLRDWSPDHGKMSKGVTLTAEEVLELIALLEENMQDFTGEPGDEASEESEESSKQRREPAAAGRTGDTSGGPDLEPAESDYAGELYEASA